MCTVAEVRCHEAEIEASRPERVRPRLIPRPNNLASRPHGPPGLNIPGMYCMCVHVLVTTVGPTKTAERTEMPFGVWSRVGLKTI